MGSNPILSSFLKYIEENTRKVTILGQCQSGLSRQIANLLNSKCYFEGSNPSWSGDLIRFIFIVCIS